MLFSLQHFLKTPGSVPDLRYKISQGLGVKRRPWRQTPYSFVPHLFPYAPEKGPSSPGLPFCAQEGDGHPSLHTRLAWSPRSHLPPWSNRKAWENVGSLTASGAKTSPNKGPFLKHSCSLRGMPGQGRLPLLPASQQGQAKLSECTLGRAFLYPSSLKPRQQGRWEHSAGGPALV